MVVAEGEASPSPLAAVPLPPLPRARRRPPASALRLPERLSPWRPCASPAPLCPSPEAPGRTVWTTGTPSLPCGD